MSGSYVSPIPVSTGFDYADRIEGQPVQRRIHHYPQADGSSMPCRPRYCRECWREGYRHV